MSEAISLGLAAGGLAVNLGLQALTPLLGNVLLRPFRGIQGTGGIFIPDVTVHERHSDRLHITEHPVEQGAAINDHAYKMAPRVTLEWGWSEALFGEGYAAQIYGQLVRLQDSREPFMLFTGKRMYPNMLLESLEVRTDNWSEYALVVEVECKQVLIAFTQAATLPASTQAQPAQTAGMQDSGRIQTQELPPPQGATSTATATSNAGLVPGLQ